MDEVFPYNADLPPAASGAVSIVRALADAGHQALLAGGCVRDLLLGHAPQDYDVATDAPPERVCTLFRPTRKVGAQFGVVLVRKKRRWVEVATFRSDGPYLDGRHPVHVTLSDARHDAQRRDFTVNGMFLDPLDRQIIDYVGGMPDLRAGILRAIGTPAERFREDYLRMLRAVRFAARLGFPIEAATRTAIRENAPNLRHVAAERVRDELARMLAAPARRTAWRLLQDCDLLPHLCADLDWTPEQIARIDTLLGRLPVNASFELVMAILLADRPPTDIDCIARALTLSNDEREAAQWLVAHQADLDDPTTPSLADLKRLLAGPAPRALRTWAEARYADLPGTDRRRRQLRDRLDAIPADAVAPPPLVTGADLISRGIVPGPAFKRILDELYTRQLDEELTTGAQAAAALDAILAREGLTPGGPPS